MDQRIDTLAAMFDKTATLLTEVRDDHMDRQTPCPDYDVAGLLEHIAVWVQVFDGAVNNRAPVSDLSGQVITDGWHAIFTGAAKSIIDGLVTQGSDRPMSMTGDPIPGEFVLDMLLMEYIGHGWDLCRAVGRDHPFTGEEATSALTAAQAIIQPEYRGHGMFGDEVAVAADADPMDAFVAFLGRQPSWTPSSRP